MGTRFISLEQGPIDRAPTFHVTQNVVSYRYASLIGSSIM